MEEHIVEVEMESVGDEADGSVLIPFQLQFDKPVPFQNIHSIVLPNCLGTNYQYQLKNSSISKVALSRDLCRLEVLCSGELIELGTNTNRNDTSVGLHCLNLDTSIFLNRWDNRSVEIGS